MPLFLALALVIAHPRSAKAVEIDVRLQEIEKYLEVKVEKHLAQLFPAVPVVVSVRLRPTVSASSKNDAKNESKPGEGRDSSDTFVDLGYIPFPVSIAPEEMMSSPARRGPAQKFEGSTVTLQTDHRTDAETVEMMKESITEALDGYAPTVNVKRIGKPGSTAKVGGEGGGGGAGGLSTLRLEDRRNQEENIRSRRFAALAQFFAALLIALALGAVAYFLRRSATAVADGIRSLANAKGKSGEAEGGTLDGSLNLSGTTLPLKFPVDPTANSERNLSAVRAVLTEKPELIAQELLVTPEDADGLRWILPTLQPAEQEALRQWLGPAKAKQLLAMASTTPPSEGDAMEVRHRWLQRFVERLAMRRVRGGSPVDAALGAETALQVSALGVPDIEKWVLERTDAASWRVASEFIPAERFARLLDKMEGSRWVLLADAAGASAKEIKIAAKHLIDSKREADPEAAKRKEERSDYFQRVVLDPLTAALKRRPLAEQEGMIAAFEKEHPDLMRSLEQRFWSLPQLRRVPEDRLQAIFRPLSTEEKVQFVAALPEKDAQRFIQWLPEGNVRVIVEDQSAKIRKRKDAREMGVASEVAQRFIDKLRLACLDGEFALTPSEPTPKTVTKPYLRAA